MRIIAVTYGTGGSEIFSALARDELFDNIVILSLSKYAAWKNPMGTYLSPDEVIGYLEKKKPDVVINERSNGLDIHNKIERHCQDNGITTICLLDMYGDYDRRFKVIPNHIIVPSESIKKELMEWGVEECMLHICGNAAYDSLTELKYEKEIDREKPRVLYVSQGPKHREDLLMFMEKMDRTYGKNYSLEIKTHPQEDDGIAFADPNRRNVSIVKHDNQYDFIPKCLGYDLVVGRESTIQLKTNLLEIPTLFFKNKTSNDVEKFITDFKNGIRLPGWKYDDFERGATEKTLNTIRMIMEAMD